MPSRIPVPSINDLVSAFHGAAKVVDKREDSVDGSAYDYLAGLGAMIFSREAQRDRDMFEATYFDTATGQDASDYANAFFQLPRILDTKGVGTITLTRATVTAGVGTIWAGTRIRAAGPFANSIAYLVTSDTPVSATATSASNVPVTAEFTGLGVAYNYAGAGAQPYVDDPLWDNTWTVAQLSCAEGTVFEPVEAYKRRVQASQQDKRLGYARAMIRACKAVGAVNVVMFASDYGGDTNDFGTNVCYVGDASYTTPAGLTQACEVALEAYRVLGCDLFVLPMINQLRGFNLTATLSVPPATVDQDAIKRTIVGVIMNAFSGSSAGYSYDLDDIRGSIFTATNGIVQGVNFTSPAGGDGSGGASILQGTLPSFPSALTRFVPNPSYIFIKLQ